MKVSEYCSVFRSCESKPEVISTPMQQMKSHTYIIRKLGFLIHDTLSSSTKRVTMGSPWWPLVPAPATIVADVLFGTVAVVFGSRGAFGANKRGTRVQVETNPQRHGSCPGLCTPSKGGFPNPRFGNPARKSPVIPSQVSLSRAPETELPMGKWGKQPALYHPRQYGAMKSQLGESRLCGGARTPGVFTKWCHPPAAAAAVTARSPVLSAARRDRTVLRLCPVQVVVLVVFPGHLNLDSKTCMAPRLTRPLVSLQNGPSQPTPRPRTRVYPSRHI